MKSDLKNPKWRLLVFRRAMSAFSVSLILCAMFSGACGIRLYFTFAAAAAGTLLWCRAWFGFCRRKDGRPRREEAVRVPAMLRGAQARRRKKPAFLMNGADFDDDLTRFTAANEEDFAQDECLRAREASDLLAGALMMLVSFVL